MPRAARNGQPVPVKLEQVPPYPRGPFPHDQFLRRAGFRIVSRPVNGPSSWVRDACVYEWTAAMAIATREREQLIARIASDNEAVADVPGGF